MRRVGELSWAVKKGNRTFSAVMMYSHGKV